MIVSFNFRCPMLTGDTRCARFEEQWSRAMVDCVKEFVKCAWFNTFFFSPVKNTSRFLMATGFFHIV